MEFLLSVFVFLFGTIVGSFLNVVILRYNTGRSVFSISGRSVCFSCGKKLNWYELVPVFSFVFQRGRCRGCGSNVSWQYPMVEVATGLIFLGIFSKLIFFPPVAILMHFVIWSLLIVITVYDLRHKIIPDMLVYMFALFSLLASWFFPQVVPIGSFSGAILASLIFFTFFGGLWLVSKGRWLGFGDAKLVVGVGFLLGLIGGLSALALAFWIGAAFGILLILTQKVVQSSGLRGRLPALTMKSEVPFAPFIILGTLIVYFFHFNVLGLIYFF